MSAIAVVGPGAVGGTFAAALASANHDVVVCARTPFKALSVETPEGALEANAPVLTDPAQLREDGLVRPFDWVLVAVKTYDAEGTIPWLRALVGPTTSVAILQNGVEHVERFEPYVERERIVPVVVDLSATKMSPGVIVLRRAGIAVVPATARGRAFQVLFEGPPLRVEVTDDFKTAAWRKLCLNSIGIISAITCKPARIGLDEDVGNLMRGMLAECVAVGRAEGARLPDEIIEEVLARYRRSSPEAMNSLVVDRLAGRRTEVDARNGVVVRKGQAHGIPTPLHRAMMTLLKACRL